MGRIPARPSGPGLAAARHGSSLLDPAGGGPPGPQLPGHSPARRQRIKARAGQGGGLLRQPGPVRHGNGGNVRTAATRKGGVMTGTHHRGPSRGLIVALVVVAADIAVLAFVAVSNLARGHWLTGILALLIAAGFVAALLVIRALGRLVNVLIRQNARLLYVMEHPEAEVPSDRSA